MSKYPRVEQGPMDCWVEADATKSVRLRSEPIALELGDRSKKGALYFLGCQNLHIHVQSSLYSVHISPCAKGEAQHHESVAKPFNRP